EARCLICQRGCFISEGSTGFCGTRINRSGSLYSNIYGLVSVMMVSPVEKKPFYHFHPGSKWLSLGSYGCNFKCPGCQNWDISHASPKGKGKFISPEEVVEIALKKGCRGISWTYNEPTLWLEYTLDAAKLAKEKGLLTTNVTNGFFTEDSLDLIAPYLDASRVDIKGFSKESYGKIANIGKWEGILDVVEKAKNKYGIHVEIITNIIPTLNDDPRLLKGIAGWMRDSLGKETPWHVTRFHPHLDLSHLPSTPLSTLERAHEIGKEEGLDFVYLGNVPGHKWEDTYCPGCGKVLIKRYIFEIVANNMEGNRCPECRTEISGRFE
ncbi:MAG: AmmeMemoRadiSam system radical SAM enzyme, partial [Thermoplasmatota archaeon]